MRSCLDDAALLNLLQDDAPYGDLTTRSLHIDDVAGKAVFRARHPMRVCATEEAVRLFELAGAHAEVVRASGTFAAEGTELLSATGPAAALHLAWKTAQTLIEYASGIATAAAEIVDALHRAGFATPVACTRKHFPGTKPIAVKAVQSGGAVMHRLGLSETLLVFPEHRAFLREDQLAAALGELGLRNPEKKRVAEVNSTVEALAIAAHGIEVLQLEKFSPEDVARCKSALREKGLKPILAAAGGITAGNAVAYASAGADMLVTSAPYFAKPRDVKVAVMATP